MTSKTGCVTVVTHLYSVQVEKNKVKKHNISLDNMYILYIKPKQTDLVNESLRICQISLLQLQVGRLVGKREPSAAESAFKLLLPEPEAFAVLLKRAKSCCKTMFLHIAS